MRGVRALSILRALAWHDVQSTEEGPEPAPPDDFTDLYLKPNFKDISCVETVDPGYL